MQCLDQCSRTNFDMAGLRVELDLQSSSLHAAQSELSYNNAYHSFTLAGLQERLSRVEASLATSRTACVDAHEALCISRSKTHAVQMQLLRANHSRDIAHQSVRELRSRLQKASTWSLTKHGTYTPETRAIARSLCSSGCAQERVGPVLALIGKVMGIRISRAL